MMLQLGKSGPLKRVDAKRNPFSSRSHPSIINKSGSGKFIKKYLRQLTFIIFYLTWLLVLRWVTNPRILFLVYGPQDDQRSYWPEWFNKFLLPVFPVGLMRRRNLWGWVIASTINVDDLENVDMEHLFTMVTKIFGTQVVCALAGRLPGVARKKRIEIRHPFVDGSMGTRYTILEAALAAASHLEKEPRRLVVAVLGGRGYTGTNVVKDLSIHFYKVIGIDPQYALQPSLPNRENQSFSPNVADVGLADIVIVLTAKGDECADMIPYLKKGMVVLDDTHPGIKCGVRERIFKTGAILQKVTMNGGGVNTFPRLPNFRQDDIPGCVTEAIAITLNGRGILSSLENFGSGMKKYGLQVRLADHPNDS